MRDPLSRFRDSLLSSTDSWFLRVRENLRQLFHSVPLFPSSANGAPIHSLKWERSPRAHRAQSASFITHAAIIAALALVALHPPDSKRDPLSHGKPTPPSIPITSGLLDILRGHHPNGGNGNGTGHDILPPTQGNLPPRSSIQLLKPTLPQNQNPELPIPPTILDPSAARILTPTDSIGLPWMPDQNGSSGSEWASPGPRATPVRSPYPRAAP